MPNCISDEINRFTGVDLWTKEPDLDPDDPKIPLNPDPKHWSGVAVKNVNSAISLHVVFNVAMPIAI